MLRIKKKKSFKKTENLDMCGAKIKELARWWRNIYKEDMDLLYPFQHQPTMIQRDYIKWGTLYGYYFGYDGRRRVNDGPCKNILKFRSLCYF